MIFNSRRAMASPILKDRVFLALNLKTGYGRRIIKLFFRITPNSIPNLAIHRDRTARYSQQPLLACNTLILVMGEHDLNAFAKYYDQIYLKRNDYKSESEVVQNTIRRCERKPSKTLLDVGCGTGEHLKHLSQHFRCTGLDISKEMINTARQKVPNAKFHVADMIDFKLRERFDVVTCLFSSIGYVQNFRNLARTLRNFYDHLTNDGLALVEPWVFKKDFRKGNLAIDTYEDEKTKLARMGTSKLTQSHWLVQFHYLIGTNEEIKHTKETHKMIAADHEDYVKGFNLAGYKETKFLRENEWTRTRGLFVATK